MTIDKKLDPKKLTQRIIFIVHQLGMYHAELARVLGVRCGDIGQLSSGKMYLEPGSNAWHQAEAFAYFYELLDERLQGEEVAMYHWLRAENADLAGVPLLLIIDDYRLEDIIHFLESGRELITDKSV